MSICKVDKTVEISVANGQASVNWDSHNKEVCIRHCRTEDIADTIACLTALKNQIDSLEEDTTNG